MAKTHMKTIVFIIQSKIDIDVFLLNHCVDWCNRD